MNINKDFVFFVNPNSSGGKNFKQLKKILQIFENFDFRLEVIEPINKDQLNNLIVKYYNSGKRNYLVAGGDGSLYHFINAMMKSYHSGDAPLLGIIPTGTGNALYSSLNNYEQNFKLRIEQSISNILKGEAKSLDIFKVEGENNKTIYFVNMFLMGFFSKSIEFRNKYLNKFGNIGYDLSCIYKVFFSKNSKKILQLKIDNKIISYESDYISYINNSKLIGCDENVSPLSMVNDGKGELVIWKNAGKFNLLKNLLKVKLGYGEYLFSDNISYYQFKELEFLSNTAEENIIIDGEVVSINPKKITILQDVIKVF